jgi:hypothetical protein
MGNYSGAIDAAFLYSRAYVNPWQQHAPGTRRIVNAAYSQDGSRFVTIDELKTMTLFSCNEAWKCVSTRYGP